MSGYIGSDHFEILSTADGGRGNERKLNPTITQEVSGITPAGEQLPAEASVAPEAAPNVGKVVLREVVTV